MLNRHDAKRFIYMDFPPLQTETNTRKSIKQRLKDLWNGDTTEYLDLHVDSKFYRRLPLQKEADWLRLILDNSSHTLTLVHPRLKPNYPAITIPAGTENYLLTVEAGSYRFRTDNTVSTLPSIDYRKSDVTRRIIEFIYSELKSGELLRILKNRAAWSMWLECWESGFVLGFTPIDESSPAPELFHYEYEEFETGSSDDFDELCTADTIGLESFIMNQVQLRLGSDSPIEIFYEDQFYGAHYRVDVLGSATTWELRSDFIDYWKENGSWYQSLHDYNVFRAQMHFEPKGITVYFEGYPGESKALPAQRTTYYAGQAHGSSTRYDVLTSDESKQLEDFLIRHLEDECKLIGFTPIPGQPHCYYINDHHKLHYKGQDPYWAD